MIRKLENPFYYLDNFHTVLEWIAQRYRDLLIDEERAFIERFARLPRSAQALLVRMVMRKGELFRASKLIYDEIGCPRAAVEPLLASGWIDDKPLLTLDELFGVLRKAELTEVLQLEPQRQALKKVDLLAALNREFNEARHFDAWCAGPHATASADRISADRISADRIYKLRIGELCDRFRLMFFGNLRQDWTEFVLAELGLFSYEKVEFSAGSRGFQSRDDVDGYLHLHRCRERFEQGEALETLCEAIPAVPSTNPWLEERRAKLIFQIAQHYERSASWQRALDLYSGCAHPGARLRAIRVLELSERWSQAFEQAEAAYQMPESEAEQQQLSRMLPRLRRKAGQAATPKETPAEAPRRDLLLPKPPLGVSVESAVREYFAQTEAPAYYVENTLINSLFGLLCWKAIFSPLPGAFFHPFHAGPADLHRHDFQRRRQTLFDECFAQLDSGRYRDTIRQTFRDKMGIQSPFVAWGLLDETLLETALECVPAAHLRLFFQRILLDIRSNRNGLPDLIQFWPAQGRYRMIEVKGPGDRLQDNQIRWLRYCMAHAIPVEVCYVRWLEGDA